MNVQSGIAAPDGCGPVLLVTLSQVLLHPHLPPARMQWSGTACSPLNAGGNGRNKLIKAGGGLPVVSPAPNRG